MAGFLSPTGTPESTLRDQEAARRTLQSAGKAYSNYRQFSRDNYANQLSNQSSLYQGMMNRLASAYGAQGSPNVSQMSNNPMSLRQTTVGSTFGSNAVGWGQGDPGNKESGHLTRGDDNFGLIGQMGAINPNDQLNGNPNRIPGINRMPQAGGSMSRPATIDSAGRQILPGYNIDTQNTWAPPQVSQSGAPGGQFNFAPRRY